MWYANNETGSSRQRFTLGRKSSLAPPDLEGSSTSLSLPEQLDAGIQLLFLASKGDVDGIDALLAHGADVNFTDFDDRTALHIAACEGHVQVVHYLLRQGANCNARDRWGSTPLSDAKHYGNEDVCKILEAHGSKVPELTDNVPMRVTDAIYVPEYEIKPEELVGMRKISTSKYIAKWHGTMVAVKILPRDLSNNPESVKAFRDELALLQRLRHPNIVQFLGAVTQDIPMCIVEEYCVGKDLHAHLQQEGRLHTEKAVRYALDIARGLNYLHECKPEPVIHRDLNPRKILRDGMGHVKVGDFALNKLLKVPHELDSETGTQKIRVTSCYYAAPELLRLEGYDQSVDVFSFAIILQQMIEGHRPFHSMKEEDVIQAIAYKDERPPFKAKSKYYPGGLKELIQQCWSKEPLERPSFDYIIKELERIKPLCAKKSFWRKALFGMRRKTLNFESFSLRY